MARQAQDAGFTLIEAVASLAIATVMLTGLAYATVGGARGSTLARINQQAGDVLESTIEAARSQSYGDLVMYASDPNLSTAKDSRLKTGGCPAGGTMCITVPNPTGSGTTMENIVTSTAVGFQANHIQKVTTGTNNVEFTVATYVTKPAADDTSVNYKRITGYVSWSVYGVTHTRSNSTYVTSTQRGLPLPKFTLDCASSCSTTALTFGTGLFQFTLTNSGARDSFDLTATNGLSWTYYRDNDNSGGTGIGQWDGSSIDTPLTDSSGNGVPDTGLIDTAAQITFWAVATPVAAGTYTITFTATSAAQPSLTSSQQSQTATLVVSATNPSPSMTASPSPSGTSPSPVVSTTPPSNCLPTGDVGTSATGYQYYLHNALSSDAASAASYPMSFNTGIPSTTNMPNYSNTDGKGGGQIGRNLSPTSSPSINATSPSTVASWQFTVTSNKQPTVSGTVLLRVWAEVDPTNPPAGNQISLQAMVGYDQQGGSTTFVEQDSVSGGRAVSASGCNSWQQFVFAIPIKAGGFQVKKGGTVSVSLFNRGAGDVRIGYGSNTSTTPYPADVWFSSDPGSFVG